MIKRLKRFLFPSPPRGDKKKTSAKTYPFSHELEFEDHALKFNIHSAIEEVRIAKYGGERSFLYRFLDSISDSDTVLDAGASVGLFTVHAAAIARQVIAVEPDPETCARLRENVSLNSLNPVEVKQIALSDSPGTTELYTDGAAGFAPSMKQQTERENAPNNSVIVPKKTVDNLIRNGEMPAPTVVKIDIEGAEALMLRGARSLLDGTIAKKPRVVFVEVHPEFLKYFDGNSDEILQLFTECGYKITWQECRENEVQYQFELA